MTRPALVLVTAALLAGCSNGQPGSEAAASPAGAPAPAAGWRSAVLLDTGSKLSGVAVGDLLPDAPGNELVVVGTDHKMHLCYFDGQAWKQTVIGSTPGEMIQVAAGDVDPTRPGDEIVAVGVETGNEDDPGAKGAAVYVYRNGDEWKAEQVFQDSALLHGVCIKSSGVWVAGFSGKIHLLGRQAKAPWPAHSATLTGPGKSIAATPGGVVVACKDGSVAAVSLSGVVGPVPATRDKRDGGRARIAAAGNHVLVADDDGTLTLLTGESGPGEVLFKAEQNLRGAVLADLDPAVQGLEAATAGYDGTIRVFTGGAGHWSGGVVARDTDRFHHLASGVLPGWPGTVLIGVNYSGKVTVAGIAK